MLLSSMLMKLVHWTWDGPTCCDKRGNGWSAKDRFVVQQARLLHREASK